MKNNKIIGENSKSILSQFQRPVSNTQLWKILFVACDVITFRWYSSHDIWLPE